MIGAELAFAPPMFLSPDVYICPSNLEMLLDQIEAWARQSPGSLLSLEDPFVNSLLARRGIGVPEATATREETPSLAINDSLDTADADMQPSAVANGGNITPDAADVDDQTTALISEVSPLSNHMGIAYSVESMHHNAPDAREDTSGLLICLIYVSS
jgi:hypothetical protein